MSTQSNACFLGPTRVHIPISNPIGSAVFAQLTADSPYTLYLLSGLSGTLIETYTPTWAMSMKWNETCSTVVLWCGLTEILITTNHHHHTTTVLRPFFWDHPGELVLEENFWTLWCKGRLTETDTPTIRMGATPSGLISDHLHHHPHYFYICHLQKIWHCTQHFARLNPCKFLDQFN